MNEKIKGLAKQAGLEIATNSVGMPIIVAVKNSRHADPEEGLIEFAELIAKDCAQIARAGLAEAAARVIEEQYGVKK